MINQNEVDENKKIIRKDVWFACSMLIIYAICFILFVGGSYSWIREDRRATYENATATEAAFATQQANMTATVVAHVTEQAQYEYIERFDNGAGRWYTGDESGDFGEYSVFAKDGVYVWDITDSKGYTKSIDYFRQESTFKDYDLYVDIKFASIPEGSVCSGLVFRKNFIGWDGGAYVFNICSNKRYYIAYYKSENWDTIYSNRFTEINSTDWNRIEVSAKGDHFVFTINNETVFETTDDRRSTGILGLFIELNNTNSAEIWFDNFGVQRH